MVILFRDVMTYGFLEKHYLAGEAGRGSVHEVRQGTAAGPHEEERQAHVKLLRPSVMEEVTFDADLLVL